MKKITTSLLALLLLFTLVACGSEDSGGQTTNESTNASETEAITAQQSENSSELAEVQEEPIPDDAGDDVSESESSNILIAYFSRMGNMNFDPNIDAVSSATVQTDGSDFVGNCEVVANTLAEQTGGDVFFIEMVDMYPANYRETTEIAGTEQSNNARPALASQVDDIEKYDTIILVYPNWWGTLPQAVFTFLEEYDFAGKTILPVATHEGSGLGRGPSDIAGLCPDSVIMDGLSIRGSGVNNADTDISNWLTESGL